MGLSDQIVLPALKKYIEFYLFLFFTIKLENALKWMGVLKITTTSTTDKFDFSDITISLESKFGQENKPKNYYKMVQIFLVTHLYAWYNDHTHMAQ